MSPKRHYQFQSERDISISILFIIGKHIKMLCFQFQQNPTIHEEFDFLEGGWERYHISKL